MRVLLHPGFHKTGTSSLQRSAEIQHRLLAPRLQLRTIHDLSRCVHTARSYATRPEPRFLVRFRRHFDALAAGIEPDPARPALISCEGLGGRLPGLDGVTSYGVLPALCRAMVDSLQAHLPGVQITLWLTTRAPEAWLRSAWWQALRVSRLTEDFDSFAARLAPAADFQPVVSQTARAVGKDATTCATRLEKCNELPLGTLGVALRLLGVSARGLAPSRRHNVQPDGAAEALLDLNRSALDGPAHDDAKRAFMEGLRRTGSMTRLPDRTGKPRR